MSHSIESIASTRKRTKENVRVSSLIPLELRESSKRLIELLLDYYVHLNEKGQPSSDIASISNSRDLDTADSQYLDLIQKEIAASVPKNVISNRVKLYKNLMKYYAVRGSTNSIELFFKILFDDIVEVYYPKKDMLIPSSGTWDQSGRRPVYDSGGTLTGYENGVYLDNRGFLSDTIKIQDSFFYQQFSYVIRTGNNVETWKNSFNRLVHPAGFIFFGEILIILEALNGFSRMPHFQPGLISDEDVPLLILLQATNPAIIQYLATVFSLILEIEAQNSRHPDMTRDRFTGILHFFDGTASGDYDSIIIEDAINNVVPWNNVGSYVTLLASNSIGQLEDETGSAITDETDTPITDQ